MILIFNKKFKPAGKGGGTSYHAAGLTGGKEDHAVSRGEHLDSGKTSGRQMVEFSLTLLLLLPQLVLLSLIFIFHLEGEDAEGTHEDLGLPSPDDLGQGRPCFNSSKAPMSPCGYSSPHFHPPSRLL